MGAAAALPPTRSQGFGTGQPSRSAFAAFPYVLPGPADSWGGTGGTSGWRTHEDNILFALKKKPTRGEYSLVLDLVDSDSKGSVVKVMVNGHAWKFSIQGGSERTLTGDLTQARGQTPRMTVKADWLQAGGNVVNVSVIEGGWICFDRVPGL